MNDDDIRAALLAVTTATLTTVLLKRGLRSVWMRGPTPQKAGVRVAGRAFTLRFTPAREDLTTPAAWASPVSTRAAIEAASPGDVMVIDAMGERGAGVFGDILCARMAQRGLAALVTDGVVRDAKGVAETGLPVWCAGAAAPPSVARLHFVGWGETVACGGVTVEPGDWIVADGDGAVVAPRAIAAEVAAEAAAQEKFEDWALAEVRRGATLPGLYPPDEATRARYRRETGADA
ncbi:MAG: ribonuclease activity regulator RraA [Rubrimonas sp.]